MTRKSPLSYLALLALILLLMSIPRGPTERMRGATIALFAPLWKSIAGFKYYGKELLGQRPIGEESHSKNPHTQEEMARLQLKNHFLEAEVTALRQLYQHQKSINLEMGHYTDDFQKNLNICFNALPAHVIFRSPASWNSSLWIDVGEMDNAALPIPVIVKNSPVLIGISVVGVIDYVGKQQSRVRLITDSGLTPSVRAMRGGVQNKALLKAAHSLQEYIQNHPALFQNENDSQPMLQSLKLVIHELQKEKSNASLAKGELHGSGKPLWRANGEVLRGIGFNCDFADAQSPARDLRSGKPIENGQGPAIPILKIHDILLTTGMDGVFPAGLRVAEVTKIDQLKEGDYFYELEATPTAGSLDDLSLVFVIPPLGYDSSDQPPLH